MSQSNINRKNIVLVCAVLINLQLGMSYAWSLFSKALIELESWDYANAVLPNTVNSIACSVSMLAFGFFQEKYGPRLTIRIGALFMGSSLLLAGRFLSLPGIIIGYGVLYGTGVGAWWIASIAITMPILCAPVIW